MKVSDLLRRDAITCRLHDTLEHAAHLIWEQDIGCVPVVDERGRLCGIITDRDICTAARRPDELTSIRVSAAMARSVCACGPDDEIEDVARVMSERQLRRVPVIDAARRVLGVISRNDICTAMWACAPRSLPNDLSVGSRSSSSV